MVVVQNFHQCYKNGEWINGKGIWDYLCGYCGNIFDPDGEIFTIDGRETLFCPMCNRLLS